MNNYVGAGLRLQPSGQALQIVIAALADMRERVSIWIPCQAVLTSRRDSVRHLWVGRGRRRVVCAGDCYIPGFGSHPMRVVLEVAIVLALMLINGALAMSELAMMSSRRGRLEQRAAEGDPGARAALRLLDDPTSLLSTVQVGITLVGILAGAFSGATLGAHLAGLLVATGLSVATAHTLGIGGVVLTLTYLSLVVGELVPKRLALADPEGVASRVARPMARLARLGAPVVWLLGASTNAVLGFLGLAATPSARVTEDEIRALLAEGAAAGVVKPVEHEMIEGVMRIADRPVRAIMTPRTEIAWLDVTASIEFDPHSPGRRRARALPRLPWLSRRSSGGGASAPAGGRPADWCTARSSRPGRAGADGARE